MQIDRHRQPAELLPKSQRLFDVSAGKILAIEDTGRVLSRYVDAVVLRTFEQERLEQLASASSVPVVNSLSDFEHPCQALADLFTIRERLGGPEGRTLTYLGDGNNVAHSLSLAGAKVGMQVRMATPPGFEPIPQVVKRAAEIAACKWLTEPEVESFAKMASLSEEVLRIIASNRAHGQWALALLRRTFRPLRGRTVSVLGLAVITPTTVLLAPVGARAAHSIPTGLLRRAFALFLALTSARLFWSLL